MSSNVRRLTRENFGQVGEWAGAHECWELTAPIPEIRIRKGAGFVRARLGDVLVKVAGRVVVVRRG